MSADLKPCPHCGDEPTEYAIEPHEHHMHWTDELPLPPHAGSHVVECVCGAGMIDDTREAVLARWNRRAATEDTKDAWISVGHRLPTCSRKPDSFGVEVLIFPHGEHGDPTAFFGRRVTSSPTFYKGGAVVRGVTHWMPLPAPPTTAIAAAPQADAKRGTS